MNSETTCEKPVTADKAALCAALYAFISQRSGIEFGNYQCGDWKQSRECFNGDYLPMLRHGKQARQMLRYVELSSITADALREATRAYSGRLQFVQRDDGKVAVEYTTGQYFPTEYRKAACAVLAQAIWDYWRNECMPEGELVHNSETGETFERYQGLRAGDWIRKHARQEFGRSVASTWFN